MQNASCKRAINERRRKQCQENSSISSWRSKEIPPRISSETANSILFFLFFLSVDVNGLKVRKYTYTIFAEVSANGYTRSC